jgi:hypothetical protein
MRSRARAPAPPRQRHNHVPVRTDRTASERDPGEGLVAVAVVRRWHRLGRDQRRRSGAEELPASGEDFRTLPMAEPAVGTDAVEAARQDVQEKPPDEFRRLERHRLRRLHGIGAVVLVVETDVAVVHVEQPLVGDRHAVRVAADVLEDLLRTSEQRQSILPIVTEKRLSSITRIIL